EVGLHGGERDGVGAGDREIAVLVGGDAEREGVARFEVGGVGVEPLAAVLAAAMRRLAPTMKLWRTESSRRGAELVSTVTNELPAGTPPTTPPATPPT